MTNKPSMTSREPATPTSFFSLETGVYVPTQVLIELLRCSDSLDFVGLVLFRHILSGLLCPGQCMLLHNNVGIIVDQEMLALPLLCTINFTYTT